VIAMKTTLKKIVNAMKQNWDDISKSIPCRAPCARQVEDVYNMIIDLEEELKEWRIKLEQCHWRKGSRKRPAMIYVINRILEISLKSRFVMY